MCHRTKGYYAASYPISTPPPSTFSPSPAQLLTLVQSMSRSDWRVLKHEVKAEKRAIKAEMKAYKHELKADRGMNKRERKAMKHAVLAQLWGDVLGRQFERMTLRHGAGQPEEGRQPAMGDMEQGVEGPGYQTLRDDVKPAARAASPPSYEEVVEKDYVKL